jgi:hypothetical protein
LLLLCGAHTSLSRAQDEEYLSDCRTSRQQRAASIGFEVNSGWAIVYEGNAYDVLGAGGAPYTLLPSCDFHRTSSFVKKSCFFADILLHLFT